MACLRILTAKKEHGVAGHDRRAKVRTGIEGSAHLLTDNAQFAGTKSCAAKLLWQVDTHQPEFCRGSLPDISGKGCLSLDECPDRAGWRHLVKKTTDRLFKLQLLGTQHRAHVRSSILISLPRTLYRAPHARRKISRLISPLGLLMRERTSLGGINPNGFDSNSRVKKCQGSPRKQPSVLRWQRRGRRSVF